jgi:hypothetical protein
MTLNKLWQAAAQFDLCACVIVNRRVSAAGIPPGTIFKEIPLSA